MLNSIKYARVCWKHALETLPLKIQPWTSNLQASDSCKHEGDYHLSIMLLNTFWKKQHSFRYLHNNWESENNSKGEEKFNQKKADIEEGRTCLLFICYIIPHKEFLLNVLSSSDFGIPRNFLLKMHRSVTDTPQAALNLLLTRWVFQICMHLFQYLRMHTNTSSWSFCAITN